MDAKIVKLFNIKALQKGGKAIKSSDMQFIAGT